MKKPTISILGCGWLGKYLGRALVKEGYLVKGSVRHADGFKALASVSIEPYLVEVTSTNFVISNKNFFDASVCIVCLPFKRSFETPLDYFLQIQQVTKAIQKTAIDYVMFTSSTSLYRQGEGAVTEDSFYDTSSKRAKVLFDAEQLFFNLLPHQVSLILRIGGMYGYDRVIGKRSNFTQNGLQPVNYVHVDDITAIFLEFLKRLPFKCDIFNLVSDQHPTLEALYTKVALVNKLPSPIFSVNTPLKGKTVSNQKLKTMLDYSFGHPNPLKDVVCF